MPITNGTLLGLLVWLVGTVVAFREVRKRFQTPVEPLPHPAVPALVIFVWTVALSGLLFIAGIGVAIAYEEWPRR